MLPRYPVAAAIFLFFFCAASVAVADSGPTQQDFHRKVGDSVVLPVHIPPRAKFAELFLRTTQDRKAVAFWEPGKYLTIVDGKYSGRLTFSPHTNSFNISSLRLVDGELYQAAISPGEPTETLIGAYRLSVFNISGTANKLSNSSCSITMLCQAGMGPAAKVSYIWKTTAAGSVVARDPHLQVVLDPADKDTSYTCRADDGKGFQSQWDIAPYKEFCISGVAGLFRPGFLAGSLLAKAFLVPMLVTLLMLL